MPRMALQRQENSRAIIGGSVTGLPAVEEDGADPESNDNDSDDDELGPPPAGHPGHFTRPGRTQQERDDNNNNNEQRPQQANLGGHPPAQGRTQVSFNNNTNNHNIGESRPQTMNHRGPASAPSRTQKSCRDSLRNDVSRGAGGPAEGSWPWTQGGTHNLVGRGRGSPGGGSRAGGSDRAGGSNRGGGGWGGQSDCGGGGGGGRRGGGGGGGAREVPDRSWERFRELVFPDDMEQAYRETGNWNELFQSALDLPEETPDQCYRKWERLTTVNRDFKATAVTYGKTIISEYFLETEHKSIRLKELGGVAGGMKFVWRGILFKLADGSKGPYLGNDEAAAKGAGHDLRGATHYLATRIRGLRYALQCLIDYKGFRMTAQAVLPVNKESLRYGSSNGGKTVHNEDEGLAKKLKAAAKKLNLRTHRVNDKDMYSACDIEGHVGEGGSHYLLDFARTFPPESPKKVEHLSDILSDMTPVYVHIVDPPEKGIILSVTVPLDMHNLATKYIMYQVQLDSTNEVIEVCRDKVSDRHQSVYWRMLRPEFVKGDSETMAVV
ncbi:unnamed protein product, partial [Ectocarpus sp. 6 AP-2014]